MTARLPNLRALQIFEAAARFESFKRAAQELHVTAAAVSRQIKELERTLGFALFVRQNRKVTVTDRGARYASVVSRSFADIASVTTELSGARSKARLSLLVEREFAHRWLMPNLSRFNRLYPDIDIEIVPATEISELPTNGPAAAITYRRISQHGLKVDHLLSLHAFPVCSPRLLTPPNRLQQPKDLGSFRLVHDRSTEWWKKWLGSAQVTDVEWWHGHVVYESSLAIAAALAEEGVAIGDNLLALNELESGQLVKPFDLTLPTGSYFLVTWLQAKPAKALQLFRNWLIEACADAQTRCDKWR